MTAKKKGAKKDAPAAAPEDQEPKQEKAAKATDVGQAELQAKADKHSAQGFIGNEVDPEPNHSHTVTGVTGKD